MNYYANGISYEIIEESDGWFSIYEIYMGRLFPLIQSSDIEHVKEYCNLREPVPIPMSKLIPDEKYCKKG